MKVGFSHNYLIREKILSFSERSFVGLQERVLEWDVIVEKQYME